MRKRFGSTVHFSPIGGAREFFLVVAFSSASFPLSIESVGLALQCCIGGSSTGFNVKHLAGRQFRFSVASNKVGHFVYGLKDRVWPDFVCHFNLYRHNAWFNSYSDQSWHSDHELTELVSCSPLAIKTRFSFQSSEDLPHNHSAMELAKFGFLPPQSSSVLGHEPSSPLDQSLVHTEKVIFGSFQSDISLHDKDNNSIRLGNFKSVIKPHNQEPQSTFIGINYWSSYWESIPKFILLHIMDFRKAGYDDSHIAKVWALDSVPSVDFILNKVKMCSCCKQLGHLGPNCSIPAIDTQSKQIRHLELNPARRPPVNISNNLHHDFSCIICSSLGHSADFCPSKLF